MKSRIVSLLAVAALLVATAVLSSSASARPQSVKQRAVACKGAAGSYKRTLIAHARAAMLADCGDIGSSAFTKLKGSASITGVGFFDESHGQTGASPNGIELHPALSYSGTCSRAGTGSGGGGGSGNCSP